MKSKGQETSRRRLKRLTTKCYVILDRYCLGGGGEGGWSFPEHYWDNGWNWNMACTLEYQWYILQWLYVYLPYNLGNYNNAMIHTYTYMHTNIVFNCFYFTAYLFLLFLRLSFICGKSY